MLALAGRAAAGSNRVSLDYFNPKVFQSSKRNPGSVQLVDINARVRGKKTVRADYAFEFPKEVFRAKINNLFAPSTSNFKLGAKLNTRMASTKSGGRWKLFEEMPGLYYDAQNSLFQLRLPPGCKVYCSAPRFFAMLGLLGESEVTEGKFGFENPAGASETFLLNGEFVMPENAVSLNYPPDMFEDTKEAAGKDTVVVLFVMEANERTGSVTLDVARPVSLADSRSVLATLCREVERGAGLTPDTIVVVQDDDLLELYARPGEFGDAPLVLRINFDAVAKRYLDLERSRFRVDLAEIPAEDQDQTRLGVLFAGAPPTSAHNAMKEYQPYCVMTDSPPFNSWVSGKGNASVLAYVELEGGLTPFPRALRPDFGHFNLTFFNQDLSEMIFDDDLDVNIYFALI